MKTRTIHFNIYDEYMAIDGHCCGVPCEDSVNIDNKWENVTCKKCLKLKNSLMDKKSSIVNSEMEYFDNLLFNDISKDLTYNAIGKVHDYSVHLCTRKEISEFVEFWHYSKNVNGLTTDYCFKLLDINGIMIGAMIYGKIAMANVWKKYAVNESDLIELKRLCCIDNTPKNTESYFISNTLRWLKKNTKIKSVISYADTTYNHEGTIYKASNFAYKGMTAKGRVIMYNGKRYHDKTIRTKYKGELKPFAVEIKKALDNGGAEYAETLGKHIYIYELTK